jgi:hypothetical protein
MTREIQTVREIFKPTVAGEPRAKTVEIPKKYFVSERELNNYLVTNGHGKVRTLLAIEDFLTSSGQAIATTLVDSGSAIAIRATSTNPKVPGGWVALGYPM